ncbi:carboxypeptidase regulatory-like domain-containing protein [Hymenobacter gummosus]|uniref:Carboxypeptidase regulatory-like domain-containing protein n=1 Tax=Hymenobacter gummosus TaxID=1776032 RepID=A0A431TYW3_9BACT|nr:carboxypeptidase-like regulatory domain-containing protein [Hymenobacter gummosus]RTQ47196.1 carboxypeptidase regulatory-like domain-containing protein [Hymenobacter gummosus]
MKALSVLACGLLLTAAAQAQQLAAQSDTTQLAAAPVAEPAAAPAAAVDPELPTAPAAPATLECNTLAGRVTDAFDYPLTGATVMLRSQGQSFSLDAFSTNADGRYLITSKKPIPRDAVLEVTAAGYSSFTLPLANCRPLDVTLEPLPGTKFKGDGRIKKTAATGKIR